MAPLTPKTHTLTDSQRRDLDLIRQGYTRGESATTCESLCRLGFVRGDWLTGYDLTSRGQSVVGAPKAVR
jgi:hypothetical protein